MKIQKKNIKYSFIENKQNRYILDLAKATTEIGNSLGRLFAVFLDNSMAFKGTKDKYSLFTLSGS